MPEEIKFFGEGLPYQTKLKSQREVSGKLIVVEGTDGVGRSTQIELLTQWLKVRGFGVVTTGWTRSKLMSKAIDYAKSGNMLDRMTFSLLYATDFADRLENEILPALRSGFIVIADRYVYTAWARDSIRDSSMKWIKDLYGFAPIPDLVCYLRIDVESLIPRVIESGGMDYWESGQDMHLADNIFDSFKKYQKVMIEAYDQMAEEFDFEVLDARGEVAEIQNYLRNSIEKVVGKAGEFQKIPPSNGGMTNRIMNYRSYPLGNSGKNSAHSKKTADFTFDPKRSANFIIPGREVFEVGGAPSTPPREDPGRDRALDDTGRPFSSLWTPAFHIPTNPRSRNSS